VTVRTVITNVLARGWENEVLDITTTFLYGNVEEEVYMKVPKGIEMAALLEWITLPWWGGLLHQCMETKNSQRPLPRKPGRAVALGVPVLT
jgi:hypothetical protein